MDIIRILLSILLPPVGVFLQVGIGLQFWINIVLTLLLTAVAFRFVARKHFDGFETKPVQTEEDPAEELQAVENVLLRG